MTFKEFLNKRTIDDETIERFGLSGDDKRVIIPVKDKEGNHLFNKYNVQFFSHPFFSHDFAFAQFGGGLHGIG